MSTYNARLSALEKNVTGMTQDIIYKFDETNSVLTALQGVVGAQGQDLKKVIKQLEGLDNRVEDIDARLARSEVQLAGLTQDVKAIQEQQNVQGQDIKNIKYRLDGFDQRFASVDERFDRIDQRFVSLEEKADQRFEKVLQAIVALTKRIEPQV